MEFKMENIKIDKSLCKKFQIKFLYLFGSCAKGLAQNMSDLDLAILFSKNFEPINLFENTVNFEQPLKKRFPFKFDIVTLNNAPALLKFEVISNGKVLYSENEAERIEFEVKSVKDYIDQQHTRDIYAQALSERISEGESK